MIWIYIFSFAKSIKEYTNKYRKDQEIVLFNQLKNSDYREFALDMNGNYFQIFKEINVFANFPLKIPSYIDTRFCNSEYLYTLDSKTIYQDFTDDKVPLKCRSQYNVSIKKNFPDDLCKLYVKKHDQYIEFTTEISYLFNFESYIQYTLNISISSEYCKNLTLKSIDPIPNKLLREDISVSDIPKQCLIEHFIEIINNLNYYYYNLYYKDDNGFHSIRKKYFISSPKSFNIKLYMDSEACSSYTYITTIESSLYNPIEIEINESNIPSECLTNAKKITKTNYFITIVNNFTYKDYCLYYCSTECRNIEKSLHLQSETMKEARIYMKTYLCQNYSFIGSFPYGTTEDYNITIDDSYINETCQNTNVYFATIVKNYTLSFFNLSYFNQETNNYSLIEDSYYAQSKEPKTIDLYINSDACTNYIYIYSINLSTNRKYSILINDSYVSKYVGSCEIYTACYYNSDAIGSFPNYSVEISNENENHNFGYNFKMVHILYDTEPFDVIVYDRFKCKRKTEVYRIKADKKMNCVFFNESIGPYKCKPDVGLIVGLSIIGFIIVVILIVVIVNLIKKRKKLLNNESLRSASDYLQPNMSSYTEIN